MNAFSAPPQLTSFPLAGGAFAQVANAPQPQAAQPAAQQPAAPAGNNAAAGNTGTAQQAGSPPPPSTGSSMFSFLLPILVIVGFYFLIMRPQQKKARELDSKLKKGDKVYTNSGMIGRIVSLGEKRVSLEIAPGVKIEVLRSAIGGLDEGDVDPKQAKIEKAEKAAAEKAAAADAKK